MFDRTAQEKGDPNVTKPLCDWCKRYEEFTIEDGLKVQRENLAEWKTKLNAECYSDLKKFVDAENFNIDSCCDCGHGVCRGSEIDTFIKNWERLIEYTYTKPKE